MKTTLRTLLSASAHLIAVFFVGIAFIATSIGLISSGIATLIVIGIGLIPLGLFALVLAGAARIEELRVSGLFGFDIPAHPLVRSNRTDWLRGPHTLWLQIKDQRNWLGGIHLVLMTILGGVVLGTLACMFRAIIVMVGGMRFPERDFSLFGWGMEVSGGGAIIAAIVVLIVGFGLLLALGLAHRAISRSMLVPSREQELTQVAHVATHRRQEAVNAAEIERTRIERDLHDGVQPRLVSVGMTLGMAKAKMATDPAAAAALIDEAHLSTKSAITELRQLARGIHPAVLDDRGLDAALSALAARSHVPVHLDVRLNRRCAKDVEAALYFTIAETLTNAAKHSDASVVRVTILEREGGRIWARIEDDGRGGATRSPGGGIDGIAGRIAAVGGNFSLVSPVGGPTTIEVSVPCAS